jgi:hypothetical protein
MSTDPVLQTPTGSLDPNHEAEIRQLTSIWRRLISGTGRLVDYLAIERVTSRLVELSKICDYDLGPTPSSGLSPSKWEAWRSSALPLDSRCGTCRALGRGPHGAGCI